MDCQEARRLVDLSVDRELDPRTEGEFERHVAGCADCRARHEAAVTLAGAVRRQATYYRAPDSLRDRITAALPAAVDVRAAVVPTAVVPANGAAAPAPVRVGATARPGRRWFAAPGGWLPAGGLSFGWRMLNGGGVVAALVAAVLLATMLPGRESAGDRLVDDAISNHARAIVTDHLIDVVSSDQHTVKPWLGAKLDYSPPVHDLASAGFPLVGARLDYLDRRPVAALVYRRDKHMIDVFVWPSTQASAAPTLHSENGWHVVSWAHDGMAYRAVSDVESSQLEQLVPLIDAAR